MSVRVVQPNFITETIQSDLESGRVQRIVTRFPPEPNGYPHLGHTFACNLNFNLAAQYGGEWVLRMDDTNPLTERQEFVDAIRGDLEWMGWQTPQVRFASDDFETMYECAVQLIEKGLAYVDSVSPNEMARLRGTATQAGTPSPYRSRTVSENLELFSAMRAGAYPDGAHLLRAKIDLANPNMKLRDPGLYRILHATHYRQGDAWRIYPLYDFAQAINDATNGVTHSLCSLEFVDNRAIYDWLLEHLDHPALISHPHQYEFGRRSLEYTVVSKRKLKKLIEAGLVSGWDDPRMPTIAAQRRRGVTPDAIRAFAAGIGVTRTNRTVDLSAFEHAIRDDLNPRAPRVMAVLRPLRVTLVNLSVSRTVTMSYYPQDVVKDSSDGRVPLPNGRRVAADLATRDVTLTKEIFIEREDFSLEPPAGYKRLTLGGRVRLRGAGVIQCTEVLRDDVGEVTGLICELLADTEKAGGVIHWVSAEGGVPFTARLYDRLFRVKHPEAEAKLEDEDEDGEERDFLDFINPNSLEIVGGVIEPSVLRDPVNTRYQFERGGYFWQDQLDSRPDALVFNRIIGLKDNWTVTATSNTQLQFGTKAQATVAVTATSSTPLQFGTEAKATVGVQQQSTLNPNEQAILETLKARGINDADSLVLVRDADLRSYLNAVGNDAASGFVIQFGLQTSSSVTPAQLRALLEMLGAGSLSRNMVKDVLEQALASGVDPLEIVERDGLKQVSDTSSLEPMVIAVIAANPDKLEAYRAGRVGLLGFFVGEVMKLTRGAGNPQLVQSLVKAKLEG